MICRNCGAGLEAERIDSSLGIITCSHCGSLHDFPADHVHPPSAEAASDTPSVPKAKLERKEVALPRKYKHRRTAGGMEVTWPVGGLFPGLVLVVIAAGFAYVSLTSGMYPLLIASAGILYFAAVQAFNKRRIRVDRARLQVTQGPLPWLGSRKLDASNIEQLFSTEHESRVKKGNDSDTRIEIRKHYRLSANTRDGARETILSGLGDPLQALWLEQEIERALGIGDKRVAGEHW